MSPGLILAGLWFSAFLASQLIMFRLFRVRRLSKAIMWLIFFAIAGYAATSSFLAIASPALPASLAFKPGLSLLSGLLLLACLFVLYLPFFYVLNTSLSVTTLIRLTAAPNHSVRLNELSVQFASPAFVSERLRTLCLNGYLAHAGNGEYALTARARPVILLFDYIKKLWRLGSGG